jgi:hypothetical protein
VGLKYAFFHWLVHILLAFILASFVASNFSEYLLIFLFTFLIDFDHFSLIKKHGIFGTIWLRAVTEFKKPRKYILHNFYFIVFLSLFSLIFYFLNFSAWKFALAVLLHLLWDLFEDAIIFKMGVGHWK